MLSIVNNHQTLLDLGFTTEYIISENPSKLTKLAKHGKSLLDIGFTKENLMLARAENIQSVGRHAKCINRLLSLEFAKRLSEFGFDTERLLLVDDSKNMELLFEDIATLTKLSDLGFTSTHLLLFDREEIYALKNNWCGVKILLDLGYTNLSVILAMNPYRDLGLVSAHVAQDEESIKRWIKSGYHSINFIQTLDNNQLRSGPKHDSATRYKHWAMSVLRNNRYLDDTTEFKLESLMLLSDYSEVDVTTRCKLEALMILRSAEGDNNGRAVELYSRKYSKDAAAAIAQDSDTIPSTVLERVFGMILNRHTHPSLIKDKNHPPSLAELALSHIVTPATLSAAHKAGLAELHKVDRPSAKTHIFREP